MNEIVDSDIITLELYFRKELVEDYEVEDEDVVDNMLDEWNSWVSKPLKTKICRVVYRKDKISEDQIHQLLADGGHDTKKVRASDKAYENLHRCCHYKRE